MENEQQKVFLLIADISGYTKFMTTRRKSLAHAQGIITELMDSIISEIKIPLHIIEIEGDAVYFYGVAEPGVYTWEQIVTIISQKLLVFFHVFYRRLNELKHSVMCHCSACDGISDLKLKIIVNIGDALFYKIASFSKLSGPDVILLHRLLKNSIEASEYLLMTERAFIEIGQNIEFETERRVEIYDDFGPVNIYVNYPNLTNAATKRVENEYHKFSFFKKLKQTMKIGIHGMLIMVGLKKQQKFRNLPG
ncbi:MAG: DUF2652 domain-containing protein [Desulfobacterales bacterium]|nr:DUF2652 domain-containing protein [Desulfobacterales bacterium]